MYAVGIGRASKRHEVFFTFYAMSFCVFDPILCDFHRILFLLVARTGTIGYCIHYLTEMSNKKQHKGPQKSVIDPQLMLPAALSFRLLLSAQLSCVLLMGGMSKDLFDEGPIKDIHVQGLRVLLILLLTVYVDPSGESLAWCPLGQESERT